MMNKYIEENKEYVNNLYGNLGKDGREYLKKRGITVPTAKFWELGFSPRNFIPEIYKNDTNFMYKKMNGRVTIPVYDSNGVLIGISGRSVYDDIKPKYMHYVFPTRSTLFGLWQNQKDVIRENAIVFAEGQFDIITAWQNGLRIAVCTFGAHCSETQFAIASRYTNRINILYDKDEAGELGTQKALKINTYGKVKVKSIGYLMLKDDDLDSWIQRNSYQKILNAINFSKIDYVKSKLSKI